MAYKEPKKIGNRKYRLYLQWHKPEFQLRAGRDDWDEKNASISVTATFIIAFIGLCITNISWWSLIWIPGFIWGYGSVYIDLPFQWVKETKDGDNYRWGFYLYKESTTKLSLFDGLWICKGAKIKCIHMPWQWDWYRTSHLRADGNWEHEILKNKKNFWDSKKWDGILFKETYPYVYILNSGEKQERMATIGVSEREWRWRALKWLPFPRLINRDINIDFNGEVGEESGSWKGGTVGCSYDLRQGEEPWEGLARMERERKFDR